MPRKAKEKIEENLITSETETKVPKKASTTTKNSTKKASTSVKSSTKKTSSKTEKKASTRATKSTKVSSNSTKKAKTEPSKVTKKATAKSTKSTTKKATSNSSKNSKTANKKSTTTKSKDSTKKAVATIEYYDLPYRYNQTIVKILAQTPNILFVYWDISDEDKNKFITTYGPNFFSDTKPYLVITNETKNYKFEVEINDYANSWYLNISDSDCVYKVELIRKPINEEIQLENNVAYITSSNDLESPNDHILFERLGKNVFFKNTQTNTVVEKNISNFSFIERIGKVYNVYDLYKEFYHDELNGDEFNKRLSSTQFSSNTGGYYV